MLGAARACSGTTCEFERHCFDVIKHLTTMMPFTMLPPPVLLWASAVICFPSLASTHQSS